MDKNSLQNASENLANIQLNSLPLYKITEVAFLNGNKKNTKLINDLINLGQKAKLPDIYYIKKDDIDNYVNNYNEECLVSRLAKPFLIDLKLIWQDYLDKKEKIPSELYAQAIKLKIIDFLYEEQTLQEEADRLEKLIEKEQQELEKSKNKGKGKGKGKKGKGKKGKDKKKGKKGKKGKKDKKKGKGKKGKGDKGASVVKEPEKEVIFNIVYGFKDPTIFTELSKLNVHVTSIIDFTYKPAQFCPNYLDNLAVITFSALTFHLPECFKEFVRYIKSILAIKKEHLDYLNRLKIYRIVEEDHHIITLNKLQMYNELMSYYPLDGITIPIIIDALIEEICIRFEDENYDEDYSEKMVKSLCLANTYPPPCHCCNRAQQNAGSEKTFLVHEEDYLKMIFNSYKDIGKEIYDKNVNFLKMLKSINLKKPEFEIYKKTMDKSVPSEFVEKDERIVDFFHLSLFHHLYENMCQEYHWKEELSTPVMLQLILKAQEEFTFFDYIYCEESDCYLMRFYHDFDSFGICTTAWEHPLATPICLRDYHKYIYKELTEEQMERKYMPHKDSYDRMEAAEKAAEEERIQQELLKAQTETGKKGKKGKKGKDKKKGKGKKDKGKKGKKGKKKEDNAEDLLPTRSKYSIDCEVRRRAHLEDLINYPRTEDLRNFCDKNEDDYIIAYDLGARRMQITGQTTIFQSFDGVKITVDNSRFLDENPKFRLAIATKKIKFMLDSKQNDPFLFQFFLPDGTLICFSKPVESQISTDEIQYSTNKTGGPKGGSHKLADDSTAETVEVPKIEAINKQCNILGVNYDSLPKILADFTQNPEMVAENDEILNVLKEAIKSKKQIYKISPNRFKDNPVKLQLSDFIQDIMPELKKPDGEGYDVLPNKVISSVYNFKITFPNGGSITPLTQSGTDLMDIKQIKENGTYRIIFHSGEVVEKVEDGSIRIFRANGEFIVLENPINIEKSGCEKDCDCDDILFYQEKMKQMLGMSDEYQTRGKFCEDFPGDLAEFAQAPFAKKSLTQFDGKEILDLDGDVVKTQTGFMTTENDFLLGEKYCERDDGFCAFFKEGLQQVQFKDGTRISTWFEFWDVEEESGWVTVSLKRKIEHSSFATILYDVGNRMTEIALADCSIRNFSNQAFEVASDVLFKISSSNIRVAKGCRKCKGVFDCFINVSPLYQGKTGEGNILDATDSYSKQFMVTFDGEYKTKRSYVKGNLNKYRCNHQKRIDTQQLFVLKPNLTGTLLWSDNMLRKKKIESDETLNYTNKLNKRLTIEFRSNSKQNFHNRFLKPLEGKLNLSKYGEFDEKNYLIVTYRILDEVHDLKFIEEHLDRFLETCQGLSLTLIDGVVKLIDSLRDKEAKSLVCRKPRPKPRQEEKEPDYTFPSSFGKEPVTMADLICKWLGKVKKYRQLIRLKHHEPYFKSDNYKNALHNCNCK